MNAVRPTGLGEPDPAGKRALFRPPAASTNQDKKRDMSNERLKSSQTPTNPKPIQKKKEKTGPPRRVRTTIDLSREALRILQDLQQQHRLETGRVLPLWKVVSEAIEYYGRMKREAK